MKGCPGRLGSHRASLRLHVMKAKTLLTKPKCQAPLKARWCQGLLTEKALEPWARGYGEAQPQGQRWRKGGLRAPSLVAGSEPEMGSLTGSCLWEGPLAGGLSSPAFRQGEAGLEALLLLRGVPGVYLHAGQGGAG